MVTTKINWSGPICDFLPKLITFGPDQFILVMTISFWSWPYHYGQVQINLVRPKPFWTDQNCFGHIEWQGIRAYWPNIYTVIAGSAFIVPSSTLQKVEPPSIDKDGIQSNVSASIGRTAYLRCKVKNLGHKSVSFQILKKSIKNIGRFPSFPTN